MGTGSPYTASNKVASFDSINRKTKLIDSGTNIQAAQKIGEGTDAYCDSSSAGMIRGYNYELVQTHLWQPKMASLLFNQKLGWFYPCSATFGTNNNGLYDTANASGTVALATIDTVEGLGITFTSAASGGSQCGSNVGIGYTQRSFNPSFKLRWKLDESGANIRFYAGFAAGTGTIANSDDPLITFNGFAIGIQTTQANYRILHNDGAGSTISDDTGVAKDTSYHTIELWAEENGSRFWWSLDNSTPVSVSTEIPANTVALNSQFIATAVNADAKVLSVLKAVITSDK